MSQIKQVRAETIVPDIARTGQRFYDEAIRREVSRPDLLANSVAVACGGAGVHTITELSHYERRQLRWVVPDGKGGVKPRDARCKP